MSTRRLAAIMFTDIEGYTRLMEEDESHASAIRKRHREIFERFHQQHHGDIIQYFGDGTLSVFDSCVEAVKCAVAMQEAFQAEPKVPLRVGIHLGDIEYSKTEVAGHGVNVASRVESLGVSGAVLISDTVNQQIQNHGFDSISMGTFDMKNVSRNMEVFAVQTKAQSLVIPNPKTLKGKGKRLDSALKTRQLIKLASIGFFALLLGAALIWASGLREGSQLLPESIREEKVGVAVFENRTGDENLNTLGYLASEWISSGLRELKVRTVSPEMVRQNRDKIGILPNNPENKPSFAEITGAKYIVAGSYFLEGDSIILNTRLSSTETGEDVHIFTPIKGHKDQREKLVEEARQYLLGYWVLKRDQKLPLIRPPKYEAYQAYLNCFPTKFLCFEEVLKIDSNFPLARIWYLYGVGILSIDSLYYPTKSWLEQNLYRLTEFERNLYNYANFRREGNYKAAFEALDANYRLDSNDYKINNQTASHASTDLNRTDISIRRYKRMFDYLHLPDGQRTNTSFYHYTDALNREGRYDETIEFYMRISEEIKAGGLTTWEFMIALMYQERMEEVWDLIENNEDQKAYILRAAYIHAYIFPSAASNPFADTLAIHINDLGEAINAGFAPIEIRFWNSRYLAYYILEDWDQAEQELKKLDQYNWQPKLQWRNQEKLWLAAAWACVYAHQGKLEKVNVKLKELEIAGKKYNDNTHIPYLRGATSYLKARIYAVLGEKEKAVVELKKSIDQGRAYYLWNIYFDLDFANLKGYPPFDQLIAPRKK